MIEELPKLLLAKHWTVSGKPCQLCTVNMVRDSFCLMLELGKVFEKSGPNHLTSLGGLESTIQTQTVNIAPWQVDSFLISGGSKLYR